MKSFVYMETSQGAVARSRSPQNHEELAVEGGGPLLSFAVIATSEDQLISTESSSTTLSDEGNVAKKRRLSSHSPSGCTRILTLLQATQTTGHRQTPSCKTTTPMKCSPIIDKDVPPPPPPSQPSPHRHPLRELQPLDVNQLSPTTHLPPLSGMQQSSSVRQMRKSRLPPRPHSRHRVSSRVVGVRQPRVGYPPSQYYQNHPEKPIVSRNISPSTGRVMLPYRGHRGPLFRFSAAAHSYMSKIFDANPIPDKRACEHISADLFNQFRDEATWQQIRTWFKNRRFAEVKKHSGSCTYKRRNKKK